MMMLRIPRGSRGRGSMNNGMTAANSIIHQSFRRFPLSLSSILPFPQLCFRDKSEQAPVKDDPHGGIGGVEQHIVKCCAIGRGNGLMDQRSKIKSPGGKIFQYNFVIIVFRPSAGTGFQGGTIAGVGADNGNAGKSQWGNQGHGYIPKAISCPSLRCRSKPVSRQRLFR